MPRWPLLEAVIVTGWTACFFWFGRQLFPGAPVVFGGLLLAGTIASHRAPNLVANGITQGVIVYLLYSSLPAQLHGGMRVGIDYLQHRGF